MAAQLMATNGRSFARAEFMDGPRHQFFTSSARARDEHRGGAGRDHLDQPEDLLHFAGRAAQTAERAGVAQAGGGWPQARRGFRAAPRHSK